MSVRLDGRTQRLCGLVLTVCDFEYPFHDGLRVRSTLFVDILQTLLQTSVEVSKSDQYRAKYTCVDKGSDDDVRHDSASFSGPGISSFCDAPPDTGNKFPRPYPRPSRILLHTARLCAIAPIQIFHQFC